MGSPLHLRKNDSHNSASNRLCQRFFLTDRQLILPVVLLAVIGYTVGLTDNLFPGGDNARYLILAKSLLTGHGYRNIGTVTAPYHTLAPPGFPLLLALVISVFGMNIVFAKMLVGAFSVISIGVVYMLFKRNYDFRYAAGIALLYGTAPLVFMYARRVYSDLPFVVVSMLALWAVDRYETDQSLFNIWILLAGLALAAAFYLRPIALALLLASTLWLIIRKKIPQGVLLFLLVSLLIAPWYTWVQSVSADLAPGHFSTFLSQGGLLELLPRVLTNSVSYARLFTENIFYVTTKGLEHLGLTGSLPYLSTTATIIFVSPLIIVGFIRCVRKKLQLTEVYVSVYFVVLLSYSLVLDRFIIPLLPFVIHYCIQGLIALTQKITGQGNERAIHVITSSFLLCVILSSSLHIAARLHQERNFAVFSPTAARYYDIARWASTHLALTAVVATDYPDFFYVYADRQAVALYKDVANLVDEGSVHFFIADGSQVIQVQGWFQQLDDHIGSSSLYCANESELCLYEIVWATVKDSS
jgi:hypothetical protein